MAILRIDSLVLVVFVLTTTALTGLAQSANPCDQPANLPSSFFEIPPGPNGNWQLAFAPDALQEKDSLVPVVVASAGALQGPANRRGLRLGCGGFRNRSEKTVSALRLRWIIGRDQDRAALAQNGYTANTMLLTGHTLPIQLTIPKGGSKRTDFSIINFAEITAPLAREGVLTGDYYLFVGVFEVVFEDGSVWTAAALPK
jgi:hypothetical protein